MEENKDQTPAVTDEADGEKTEKASKKKVFTRENLYSHIDLSVRQVDIIIAVLVVLLVAAIAVGIIMK